MAITLAILKTGCEEKDLFLKLVKRGQHADIPYYFSVNSFNWEQGWVIFERLDCAPSQGFRVGVAGKNLVVSTKDVSEVVKWLTEWHVELRSSEIRDVTTPSEAHALLKTLREKAHCAKDRAMTGIEVGREIAIFNQAVDRDLLAACNQK